ncbi:uncharacterized protein LOC144121309 [Amblyomma americanum]
MDSASLKSAPFGPTVGSSPASPRSPTPPCSRTAAERAQGSYPEDCGRNVDSAKRSLAGHPSSSSTAAFSRSDPAIANTEDGEVVPAAAAELHVDVRRGCCPGERPAGPRRQHVTHLLPWCFDNEGLTASVPGSAPRHTWTATSVLGRPRIPLRGRNCRLGRAPAPSPPRLRGSWQCFSGEVVAERARGTRGTAISAAFPRPPV